MQSNSIVTESTITARRAVLIALAATVLIIATVLLERYHSHSVYQAASARLMRAQIAAD
jgi:hypothetical protein